MNDFWNNITDCELQNMEPEDMAYPGADALVKRFQQQKRGRPRGRRTALRLMFAAAVLATLSIGVIAAREYWHMPAQGETYEGNSVQIRETQTYTLPTQSEAMPGTQLERLSDAWFIDQAVAVFSTVDRMDAEATELTVTRQTNQMWSREEVLVSFADETGNVSDATFDAESGCLIGVTAFSKEYGAGSPMPEMEALAIAQGYYATMPYAEGYVYHNLEKYDDHAWRFEFAKPIQVDLWGESMTIYSSYELVRITIDPCDGSFQLSNCFYVPLLDDHEPDDAPIEQDAAIAVAEGLDIFAQRMENYIISAEIGVCLPKPGEMAQWNGTAQTDNLNYKVYGTTRLGWTIRFEGEIDGFADCYWICVDLYTGEILSVDVTG